MKFIKYWSSRRKRKEKKRKIISSYILYIHTYIILSLFISQCAFIIKVTIFIAIFVLIIPNLDNNHFLDNETKAYTTHKNGYTVDNDIKNKVP